MCIRSFSVNSNKDTGLDLIPTRFLKDGAKYITTPLTHILNLSLSAGQIPAELKTANITPIHKKQSKTEAGNYSPISILSIVSKIWEKAIYEQLSQFLAHHNLFYELMSGFRHSFSTGTCLIHLTDYMKSEQDRGNLIGMVFLDLQKAFDTVDHNILLQKLEALGLRKPAANWFKAYLFDKQQCVDIGGIISTSAKVICGVPQGSVLGPLLVLIYVNDLTAAVKCNNVCLRNLILFGKTESILFGSSKILHRCHLWWSHSN